MATSGQANLKTNYPVVEGLAANQKHDGQEDHLTTDDSTVQYRGRGI